MHPHGLKFIAAQMGWPCATDAVGWQNWTSPQPQTRGFAEFDVPKPLHEILPRPRSHGSFSPMKSFMNEGTYAAYKNSNARLTNELRRPSNARMRSSNVSNTMCHGLFSNEESRPRLPPVQSGDHHAQGGRSPLPGDCALSQRRHFLRLVACLLPASRRPRRPRPGVGKAVARGNSRIKAFLRARQALRFSRSWWSPTDGSGHRPAVRRQSQAQQLPKPSQAVATLARPMAASAIPLELPCFRT